METFCCNTGIFSENFTTCDEIKYITPATNSITANNPIVMANILLIFFFVRKLTNGFNKIAIISAKANGTIILRSTKSMYTKSMIPKSVTVERKKNGYLFCINYFIKIIQTAEITSLLYKSNFYKQG